MKRIAILEYVDISHGMANGIHTMIRSIIRSTGEIEWFVVGSREINDQSEHVKYEVKRNNLQIIEICKVDRSKGHKKRIPFSIVYAWGLLNNRRKVKADLIHVHRIEIGFVSLILFPNIPLVQFVHNSSKDLQNKTESSSFWRFIPQVHDWISRFVYRRAKLILTFNRDEYDKALKYNKNTYQSKTWYDNSLFYPDFNLDQQPSDLLEKEYGIAWLGRLEAEKNPMLALEIFERVKKLSPNCHLHLIGYGDLYKRVMEEIERRDLTKNVTLYGHIEHSEVVKTLRNCSVLLQTSSYEGSPTSILEALACGIPVVSTLHGDPDEVIINNFNGYRISSANSEDFARAIIASFKLDKLKISQGIEYRSKSNLLPELIKKSVFMLL